MTTELPHGWTEAPLAEIAHINPPGTATAVPDEQPVTFVPMAAVEELTGRMDVSIIRAFGEVKKGFTRFRNGDVLFAKITPCMENGKITVARGLREGIGCGSTEFHVLRPNGAALPEYIRHYLVQSAFRRDAQRNMQGAVGQQRVPTDYLRESRMPVAPLPEQQRIVSRIEELFSEIDEGERALERVGRLVERYRQSVLKAAVTGELTRDWREASRSGQPSSPMGSAAPTSGSLPAGWESATLPKLGEFGRGKSKHRPRNDPRLYGGPYPFLQTGTVRASSGLISTFDATYNEVGLAQSKLWPKGTVCITIAANIAESGILAFDACFPDSIVGLVPGPRVLGEFVEMFVRTARESLDRYAPATAQKNINLDILEKVQVPLPQLMEQEEICSRARALLSRIDDIERALVQGRAQSSALRQSVLKAAFSGHLVPQDPSEEPAAALLARLATQTNGATAAPKRRSRSPRQAAVT